jgi:hypothetical protein
MRCKEDGLGCSCCPLTVGHHTAYTVAVTIELWRALITLLSQLSSPPSSWRRLSVPPFGLSRSPPPIPAEPLPWASTPPAPANQGPALPPGAAAARGVGDLRAAQVARHGRALPLSAASAAAALVVVAGGGGDPGKVLNAVEGCSEVVAAKSVTGGASSGRSTAQAARVAPAGAGPGSDARAGGALDARRGPSTTGASASMNPRSMAVAAGGGSAGVGGPPRGVAVGEADGERRCASAVRRQWARGPIRPQPSTLPPPSEATASSDCSGSSAGDDEGDSREGGSLRDPNTLRLCIIAAGGGQLSRV